MVNVLGERRSIGRVLRGRRRSSFISSTIHRLWSFHLLLDSRTFHNQKSLSFFESMSSLRISIGKSWFMGVKCSSSGNSAFARFAAAKVTSSEIHFCLISWNCFVLWFCIALCGLVLVYFFSPCFISFFFFWGVVAFGFVFVPICFDVFGPFSFHYINEMPHFLFKKKCDPSELSYWIVRWIFEPWSKQSLLELHLQHFSNRDKKNLGQSTETNSDQPI